MATKIVTKNSSTASAVPTASDLVQGELAVNVADKRLFTEDNAGAIVELGTNPTTLNVNGTATMDGLNVSGSVAAGAVVATILNSGANGAAQLYLNNDAQNWIVNTRVDDAFSIYNATSNKTPFLIATNGDISFYEDTGTTPKLFWDASAESLGIGGSTITDSNLLNIQGSSASVNIGVVFNDTNTSKIFGIQNGGSALKFFDYTASAERMRIDSSGRVGIGTSVPAVKLDVNGDGLQIRVDGTANTSRGIMLRNTGTAEGQIQTDGNMHFIQEDASKYMRFSTNNTERMRIDSSGNVGIGSSNPAYKLDLNGDMRFTSSSALFWGDTNVYEGRTGNDRYWVTGGSERMRIDSSGNVGIGTSSLTGGNTILNLSRTGSAAGCNMQFANSHNGAFYVGLAGDTSGDAILHSADGTAGMAFGTGNTERMRIDSSGKVSIGSSSIAGGSLGVNHALTGTYPKASGIGLGATSTAYTVASNGGTVSFTGGAGLYAENTASSGNPTNLVFWTNHAGTPAEAMRINSLGTLLVGKTSNSLTTAGVLLAPNGGSEFVSQGNNNTPLNIGSTDDSYISLVGFFTAGGTQCGYILGNGSAVSLVSLSDYRLKEDWQPIVNATQSLMQLKPYNFAWKADGSRTDGFLAHELQEVVPTAAHGVKNELDSDGNPKYQGIDQSKLVPLLVATIQELEARITQLENN